MSTTPPGVWTLPSLGMKRSFVIRPSLTSGAPVPSTRPQPPSSVSDVGNGPV
jgi:hypothetical protein